MKNLFFKDFKEDNKKIKALIKEDAASVYAADKIKMLVPKRYENAELLNFGDTIELLANFMLCIDTSYIVISAPYIITTEPYSISDITLDDVDYYEFSFNKGNKIVSNKSVISTDEFKFAAFKEFLDKGNTPIFMTEMQLLNILGGGLGIELLLSIVYRDPKDPNIFLRHSKSKTGMVVGLSNTFAGLKTNISRFTGSYQKDGLISLLDRKVDKPTGLEEILLS